MAVDPAFAGRVYPLTAPYLVSGEKIREFATAVGDLNPACHDRFAAQSLGYRDLVAPPTFAVVLTLPAGFQVTTDPELGLDYTRVVHGEQQFVHSRPIMAGDEVTVVVTVDSIRAVGGNDMLTLRADVTTVAGEHLVTATSMLVARGEA